MNVEAAFDLERVRADFPILSQEVNGRPLVYLDNGATTQVPGAVLDAVVAHYRADNANVHRGIHTLSERSTAKLEAAREAVAAFLGAASADEVVFTSGTTASVNMVARAWEERLAPGAAVVVTALEHHANFVPWQQACARTGAEFFVCPLDDAGDVDAAALEARLAAGGVSLVAVAHVSNVLGTVVPVRDVARMAHRHGAAVLVDAAQSARHEPLDVRGIDCDFLCLSGHKVLGPTGIGVLYGKKGLLEELQPSCYGGEMVAQVSSARTTFEPPPLRFEAGTPNYVGAIGLAAALAYLDGVGRDAVAGWEAALMAYAEERLRAVSGVRVLGAPARRAGCLSFSVEGAQPFDVAALMDKLGVAVRSGTQCAQPLLDETLGVPKVVRVSPAFYNTREEIDACAAALERVVPLVSRP